MKSYGTTDSGVHDPKFYDDYRDSIKVAEKDEDEDSRGIDFIVALPDGIEIKIDIKSSETGVREKLEGEQIYEVDGAVFGRTKDGQFVYYPKIDNDSYFKETFKLEMGAKINLRTSILQHMQKMATLTSVAS